MCICRGTIRSLSTSAYLSSTLDIHFTDVEAHTLKKKTPTVFNINSNKSKSQFELNIRL
jgi:hypothetical protein